MKFTTTNVMLGILILASLVTSYKLHQVVNRYDTLKIEVASAKVEVQGKLDDFNKVLEDFTLKYGDEIAEGLKEEADSLRADAEKYGDSLRVKASEFLKTIKTN